MSDTKYVIDRDTLVGIADAVRGKDGSTGAIAVTSLAQKITDIPSGQELPFSIDYGTFTVDEDVNIVGSRRSTDTPSTPFHNTYTIPHNLGKVPKQVHIESSGTNREASTLSGAYIVSYPATRNGADSYNIGWVNAISRINGSTNNNGLSQNIYGKNTITTRGEHYVAADENNIYLGDKDGATTSYHDYILRAGETYSWYAIAYDDTSTQSDEKNIE